jgi:polysaccharide export outer membrane protein
MHRILDLASKLMLFLSLSSCSYKAVPYFQNLTVNGENEEAIKNYSPIVIAPDDILGISVSSLNSDASAVFNYNLRTVSGINQTSSNNPVVGYLVDENGQIQVPYIGSMKVSGLTLSQLRGQLQKQLQEYLKEPVVNVRLINFKLSIMGDVLRPGVYAVEGQHVSIPEALTMAGDLNITAMRSNVTLIREIDGKRKYIPLDLTSKQLFNSPYYYLKTNDILYVQPGKNKYASVDNSYRNIGILLSALSIVVILLTR